MDKRSKTNEIFVVKMLPYKFEVWWEGLQIIMLVQVSKSPNTK